MVDVENGAAVERAQVDSPEAPLTIAQFLGRIVEGVAADIDDLRRGNAALWFGPDGKPCFLQMEKLVPFDPFSRVIGLFQNDAVIRVYTLPAPKPKDWDSAKEEWKVRPAQCITLTKIAPTYFSEEMTLATMADEITDEWNRIATGMRSADVELESVIEHIKGLDSVISRDVLVEELQDEAHRGDDEEDEEEETEPLAADGTIPAPPPAPAS